MIAGAALAAAFMVLVIEPPGAPPSGAPEPAATLAPGPSTTNAPGAPKPTASPKAALREIGRIRAVTPFCRSFTTHFNNSARTMLDNDAQISYVDFTLGGIEAHFKARAGELLFYDDRIKLMAYVKSLQKALPGLQSEINELRKSAALTTDADNAKAARTTAAELQKSYDRQRQIAIDSLGIIQAMMEYSSSKTKPEIQRNIPGGYDSDAASTPPERRDVRSYIKLQNQMDRIGDAESAAVTIAETVAERC